MPQVMATYDIIALELNSDAFEIAIATDTQVIAKADLTRSGKLNFDAVVQPRTTFEASAVPPLGILALEELVTLQIKNFAAFRNMDARAGLINAAYDYLLAHEAGRYQRATIDVEDNRLVLSADGVAAAPADGASKNSGRPRRRKVQPHSWF